MGFITNLLTNITNLRQKIGEKFIYIDTKIGNLSELNTPNKESIVKAINSKESIIYDTNTLPELKTGTDTEGKLQTAKNINDYIKYEIVNKSNWDSAYSWGNHSTAGYIKGNTPNLVNSSFSLHDGNGSTMTLTDEGLNVSKVVKAIAFYESSMQKFKYNIKPFEKSALDIINSLEIVTYDRKDIDLKNKIGVIADDSPNEILSESKEAVDLYKTIFVLAKAVQELSNKIK